MSWDDPNLEPDRDPVDGRMVPCVFCMSAPQVGGTGVCSPKCEEDLEEWIKKDEDGWDQMTKSAEQYEAMYDRCRDLDHLLAADYDRQIAYVLTHILEGDTDD